MSRLLALSLCALGAIAPTLSAGQTARETLAQVLTNLRAERTLFARLAGREVRHGKGVDLLSDLWFRVRSEGEREIAELELRQFRDSRPTRRIVGDGVTRWAYDFARNEYSASRYGSDSGAQPERYLDRLLQRFDSLLPSPEAGLGRLLKDAYGGELARASDWLPAAEPVCLAVATPDPVDSSRMYVPTADRWYILSYRPGVRNRSVCFEISVDPYTNVPRLTSIYGAERMADTKTVLSSWQIALQTTVIPDGANFQFLPPANARPIVGR